MRFHSRNEHTRNQAHLITKFLSRLSFLQHRENAMLFAVV